MQVLDNSHATKQRVAQLLLQQEGPSLSSQEKEAARRRCLDWLKKNGLPAEEDGEQVIISGGTISHLDAFISVVFVL